MGRSRWNGLGMDWPWHGAHAPFWVLVILGIVALTRWLAGGRASDGPLRGIDILKARYAKGEITKEQFEQVKRDIGEGS